MLDAADHGIGEAGTQQAGVAGAGDMLLDPLRAEVRRRVFVTPLDRIAILPAALGPVAGAIGAALWGAEAA